MREGGRKAKLGRRGLSSNILTKLLTI